MPTDPRPAPRVVPVQRGPAPANRVQPLLKDERWTRVEVVVEGGGRQLVEKTYRNRPLLLWRTLLTHSRAAREYRNLDLVSRAGVPCVLPIAWAQERRLGMVLTSTLLTEYVPKAPTLKDVLAATRTGAAPVALRRVLVRRLGRLLRLLHGGGFLGCRITPRNVLVCGEGGSVELLLLDLPAAVSFRRSIVGRRRARIDLYDAVFSPGRVQQLSRAERWRVLLAYHDGDRRAVRETWRRTCNRARWWNRVLKGFWVALDSYVLAAGRRFPPPRAGTDPRAPGKGSDPLAAVEPHRN